MQQKNRNRLIREEIRSINARSIIFTSIGILLILLILNIGAIWILNHQSVVPFGEPVKSKWDMLKSLEEPIDWLILGDSTGVVGIEPNVFEKGVGGESINLCTHADMLVLGDAWMIDESIKRVGPLKNVLIIHSWRVWHRDAEVYWIGLVPLEYGYWTRLTPKAQLDPYELWNLFLNKYVPLYSQDQSLSWLIRPWTNPRGISRYQWQDGFLAIYEADPAEVLRDMDSQIAFVRSRGFNITTPNREALNHIAKLAEEYEFEVYITNGPLFQGLYENQDFFTYFSQVDNMLNSWANQSDHLHYISQVITFPESQMTITDHLTYTGALVFTERIVSEINAIQKSGG
jgi:hypothetical protein